MKPKGCSAFASGALFPARCLPLLLTLWSLFWGAPSGSATLIPDLRTVPVQMERSGNNMSVKVPAGAASCVLEFKQAGSPRWLRWRTLLPAGRPLLGSFAIPNSLQGAEWRANANVSAQRAAAFAKNNKFPEAYYHGNTRFSRTPAAGHASGYIASVPVYAKGLGNAAVSRVADRLVATPEVTLTSHTTANTTANRDTTEGTTANPDSQAVEADIWKAQGNTVFFFNQLRGLQVLDLADAAHPKMQACLRLPAVGQDLYVLPTGDPAEAMLVLLTASHQQTGAGTEVLTVRVRGSAGTAEVVAKTRLAGWLADSRMVGGRLYVLTSNWTEAGPDMALREITLNPDGTQSVAQSFGLPYAGGGGLIAAGGDWLAVSYSNTRDWSRSNIALFSFGQSGASLLTQEPIQSAGQIYDKFKVSLEKGTLTAVSQRYGSSAGANGMWSWDPVTTVENFDRTGKAVSQPLEVVRGENLYASRFLPGRLYLVTAVQDDPLWVVDLKDPAKPVVLSHVEVPGFSTYIEPVGEDGRFLFTIGLDAGRVAASLFDVSDVTQPALLKSRVFISEAWSGFSEAVHDEKALKVLQEDGLVLVPFGGWQSGGKKGERTSFIRLLDMDLFNGGSLALRGRLDHAFAPRRAMLLNGVLVSISQKELVTADIKERDHPAVLAEVGLAWPVNHILRQDQYLLQVSDGANAGWTGETASVRVTRAADPDMVLTDIDLGEGSVQDAAMKNGKLYVLRKKWGSPDEPLPYQIMGSAVVARRAPGSELVLDVYDASALPALNRIGSAVSKADAGTVTSNIGSLLWISDSMVGVISQPRVWSFGWEPAILTGGHVQNAIRSSLSPSVTDAATGTAARMVVDALPFLPRPRFERSQPAVVRAFDISEPGKPVALAPVTLTGTQATMLTATAGGDGLLVYGYGQSPTVWKHRKWPEDREQPVDCVHRLGIVDFANPAKPVLRAPVVLPGRLFAATEVSRTGILAFTESVAAASESALPVREVKVSTVAYPTVTEFAARRVGLRALVAAEGRALFVTDESPVQSAARFSVQRAVLNDLGLWLETPAMPVPFLPTDIAVKNQGLAGVSGDLLFRAYWNAAGAGVDQWQARIWVPPARLLSAEDRSIFAPQGDFGVQVYVPGAPSVPLPSAGTPSLEIARRADWTGPATAQVAGVPPPVGNGGSNGSTQVLISGGNGIPNAGGLSVTVTGVITSSNGTSPVLGISGSIAVTGGTVSTRLGNWIAPTLMGLVP